MSIGLTRIFQKLLKEGRIRAERKSPTEVLVAYVAGREREEITQAARSLRARGLKVEMYHEATKLDTQLRYASRKGIPFVWFVPFGEGQPHEVKDMRNGTQAPAVLTEWKPSAA
jgi:histidyl-tRNA synthetase